ncbi:preprotein translocase subunit SecA [Candidatus Falkowbacteria bacterium]|uniref:Protein translocase subunit SecA n=1 Tax=Candidatus Falkowbacteria bacterium CG10_big_fil_rev_8_21_14_0_10_37_18 TaxID=1974562 RepID=A0A2H0V8S6_9BACT|nr:preprotein translocase subunit SecA [Candidatus Falkowbacteria bacterium]NCQ12604.1 preprotein translocase subunit SecA [Candidatus Falkowbacteria bacterium]OIO05569.1 MAG: preprotein translocase subunit SecA [Candidatus Falkowbacteria bacterium CG1_02_37_21]PIR95492.1 MAG: preprotein translocase subunit SecA [Candidatus Falkowbacteria bacterium CG10_big_fil_rev_8_21_14_0_10_37_18]
MNIFDFFGDANEKIIKSLHPLTLKVDGFEAEIKKLSDDELKNKTAEFRDRLSRGETLDDLLPEAFATMREAAWRILKQRHFDVQLIGGIVLHRGQIAEMKTGEGKTLVATLPLYLNALAGKGAHLVTVNDYLSRLGAGWMAPVFHALGMSTGVIVHDNAYVYDPEHNDETQYDKRLQHFRRIPRQEAYLCDVTYGTNNEFGFDYLRDNMVYSLDQAVQRPLYYAIVDEIDSILIDEARTPLIISAPAEESTDKYFKFAQIVSQLNEQDDYNIDEKMKAATLTEGGINKVEKILGLGNIYVEAGIKEVHHLEAALKARVLFKKDKDYVVKDGEIVIVDEFTGRMMPGRRYSEGLHQAIEAKEGVKVQKESRTMATITFQNLFRLYTKLSGMTGTAATEAEEFHKIYNLETIIIPTNKPNDRKDLNDLIYRTEEDKFLAVIRDIKERSAKGQPVLVGTISIEKNEVLAELMEREGLRPQMLNAKNHQREAEIIAQAGRKGAVTLATNMAGRGVDIILGGNPPVEEEQAEIRAAGGLHVVGTERHESRRIDNQLRGRAGRQGDPGSSQFYVSTDDDLMRIFGGDRMKSLMSTLQVPDDMPIENKMISKSIESAQKKVEGNNFDIRKHLVEYDDVINKHRMAIYKLRREILETSEQDDTIVLGQVVEEKAQEPVEKDKAIAENNTEPANRSLAEIVLDMVREEITNVVSFHSAADRPSDWNFKEIAETMRTIWTTSPDLEVKLKEFGESPKALEVIKKDIIDYLVTLAKEKYDTLSASFKAANLEFKEVEKGILIRSIDQLWVEHLETVDYLRRGIGLRGYGQRNPLVEYKKEAFRLYRELNGLIHKQVVYSIYKTGDALVMAKEQEIKSFAEAPVEKLNFSGAVKEMHKEAAGRNTVDLVHEKVKDESGEKVGRNDPCPCGSGKKFKRCHGA